MHLESTAVTSRIWEFVGESAVMHGQGRNLPILEIYFWGAAHTMFAAMFVFKTVQSWKEMTSSPKPHNSPPPDLFSCPFVNLFLFIFIMK